MTGSLADRDKSWRVNTVRVILRSTPLFPWNLLWQLLVGERGTAPTYTPSSEGRGRVRVGRTVGRLRWEEPSVLVPVHRLLLLVGFEVSVMEVSTFPDSSREHLAQQ